MPAWNMTHYRALPSINYSLRVPQLSAASLWLADDLQRPSLSGDTYRESCAPWRV